MMNRNRDNQQMIMNDLNILQAVKYSHAITEQTR